MGRLKRERWVWVGLGTGIAATLRSQRRAKHTAAPDPRYCCSSQDAQCIAAFVLHGGHVWVRAHRGHNNVAPPIAAQIRLRIGQMNAVQIKTGVTTSAGKDVHLDGGIHRDLKKKNTKK